MDDDEFDQWQDAEVLPQPPSNHDTHPQATPAVQQSQPAPAHPAQQYQPMQFPQPSGTQPEQQKQEQFVFEDILSTKAQQPIQHQPLHQADHIFGQAVSQPQLHTANTSSINISNIQIGNYLSLDSLGIGNHKQQVLPVQYSLAVEQEQYWALPAANTTGLVSANVGNVQYKLGDGIGQQTPTVNNIAVKVDDDWEWQAVPVTNNTNTNPHPITITHNQYNHPTNQITPIVTSSIQPQPQPQQQQQHDEQDIWVQSQVQPVREEQKKQTVKEQEQQWEYGQQVPNNIVPGTPVEPVGGKQDDDFGDYEGNEGPVLNPEPVISPEMQVKINAFLDALPDYSYIGASSFMHI